MTRRPSRRLRAMPHVVPLALLFAVACEGEPLRPAPPLPREDSSARPADPARVVVAEAEDEFGAVAIERAFHRDDLVSEMRIRARRIVYRFSLVVPFWLGYGRTELSAPTGELTVDVSGSRLRAHFSGNAFPVDENAEVRIRTDEPGAYVFDGQGGRPYGTGQLAAWFQSGPGARGVELKVRAARPDEPHIIDLVCRLFGELAGASIAPVRRACGNIGLPIRFRFGPYLVDRTAESVIEVRESALRSDELAPPSRLTHQASTVFWEPRALAVLVPTVEDVPDRRPQRGETRQVVEDGLLAENRTAARVLVTIDGVALGWLDSGESQSYPGIPAGGHRIGAMLPLGSTASRLKAHRLPAHVVLER